MLTFLADMPISIKATEALRSGGYDVIQIRELGMQRASDRTILEYAIAQSRIVLTMDKDFGTLLALSGQKCLGMC